MSQADERTMAAAKSSTRTKAPGRRLGCGHGCRGDLGIDAYWAVTRSNLPTVDLNALLAVTSDDDVVIRPSPSTSGKRTTSMLSRPTGATIVVKMRLEPTRRAPEQRVPPGHDWFFVLEGSVRRERPPSSSMPAT